MKYSYNPPFLVKKIFNNFIWNSYSSKMLLTFDDGPNPDTTETILKELNKHSIKSIFFCVGENLESYPSIAKEIISEGHEIGNHTQKHKKLTKLNRKEIIDSIGKVQEFSQNTLDYRIKFFRPPHGRFTLSTNNILKELNLINVMWSLLTNDYKNELNIVKFALTNYLDQDSIIVLHDNIICKDIIIDSINEVVEEANKKKYEIGKPSECLKYYF